MMMKKISSNFNDEHNNENEEIQHEVCLFIV